MLLSTATENKLREYESAMKDEQKDSDYNHSKAQIRRQFSFGSFFRMMIGYFR